jgi:hypothetical protein
LMRDEEQVVFVAVHAERVVENSNRVPPGARTMS